MVENSKEFNSVNGFLCSGSEDILSTLDLGQKSLSIDDKTLASYSGLNCDILHLYYYCDMCFSQLH